VPERPAKRPPGDAHRDGMQPGPERARRIHGPSIPSQGQKRSLERVLAVGFLWQRPPTNAPNEPGVSREQFGKCIRVA